MSNWKRLNVGVVGGGIGGMSVAIALRRAGHTVTIYEKSDYAGEVGASVSCAANGTRWLHEWGVDVAKGDPVVLKKLINRDWKTAQCRDINLQTGEIIFENGAIAYHDLIVGADGIGSAVRGILGIRPEKKPSDQSCLHANVTTEEAVKAGLIDYSQDSALEYWGGQEGKWDKIVLSPCNGGKLLSYYCFFPRERGDYTNQSWGAESRSTDELLAPYPALDRQVFSHLAIGKEIQPWRLWVHEPYPYIQRGNVCLLGDAGHPMMPHQSQGACMAIEDAAALGILFSGRYFSGDIRQALAVYEEVRLPRVTRVQSAAARAAYNINERIGFSFNKDIPTYRVEDQKNVLTIEEMNAYDMYKDIEEKLAVKQGQPYMGSFLCGLPLGLELPSGIIIGAA